MAIITAKKIADLAGVSRGTVDRVLHHRGGVKKEVADRIQAIAEEFGYEPNIIGKALVHRGQDKKIGVLLNAEDNPFYLDVIAGLRAKEKELRDFGYKLLLMTAKGYEVEKQLRLIDDLVKSGVVGLIISPIDHVYIAERLSALWAAGLPIICINTDIAKLEKIAYVGSNYYQAGQTAAGLMGLLAKGEFGNIAIVMGSKQVLGHNLRVDGFLDCVKTEFSNLAVCDVRENNDSDALSYKVTREILEKNPRLTGIFFCAAGIEGGLTAVEEAGKLGSLDIITVDDIDVVRRLLKQGHIGATICQEPFRQGFEALRILFDYSISGKKPQNPIFYTETQIKLKYNIAAE